MCLFYSIKLNGQAYRAGDISFKWVSGYTYNIKYTTYTTNTSFPDNRCEIDSICFGDGSNGVIVRSNGPCTGACINGCDGILISSAVRVNEYTTTHTYPGPGNYKICFDQVNRNAGIINIPNSVNKAMSLETYLVISTFLGPNSSPVFNNPPLSAVCLNTGCFMYNPAATDIDGDSLAYSILPCTVPGYTFPNAGAGGTFSINPVSGSINWCNPQASGDYNVIIKVDEWRKDADGNYHIIDYVIRETQFTVSSCTGIKETNKQDDLITVFPNPAYDQFELNFKEPSSGNYTIELQDITGKTISYLLKDKSINKQASLSFSLQGISPGIYFIKITVNDQTITKKIIKQ